MKHNDFFSLEQLFGLLYMACYPNLPHYQNITELVFVQAINYEGQNNSIAAHWFIIDLSCFCSLLELNHPESRKREQKALKQ